MSIPDLEPRPPEAEPSSRGRAWSFLVGGDLAYRVLAAGFWLVLARAVSAPALGDVALATALSLPALVVLDGGLAQYLVREARPADGGRLPGALRTPLRRRTVGLFLLPLGVAVAMLGLGATGHRLLIGLLVGMSASFEGAAHGWLAAPRGRGDMRPDATFRTVYGAVTLVAVAIAWAAGGLTGLLAAGASATGAAIAAAVTLRHRPGGLWIDRELEQPRDRRRFTYVMLLGSAFLSADVLVVGAMLGSAVLAPYALASKIVATLQVLPSASLRVSLSWAARNPHAGAAEEARVGARMGLALASAGVVAGPWGASLVFGEEYGEAMLEPLRILSVALIFVGLKSPLAGRHLGAGDTAFLVRVSAVTLGTGAFAVPLGILALGTTGAALGVLLAEATGITLYVRRRAADGWGLRDILPSAPGALLVAGAVAGGLLLPAFSALVLLPAAVAAAAAFELRPPGRT